MIYGAGGAGGQGVNTYSSAGTYGQRRPQAAATEKKQGYFLQKVVLITGASSGVGRSLAFWYLNNGARVALVGRDLNQLDMIAK